MDTSRRVEAALDRIRPFVRREGGELVLLGIVDRCVELRVVGTSAATSRTLTNAVGSMEVYLRDVVPGLKGVRIS